MNLRTQITAEIKRAEKIFWCDSFGVIVQKILNGQ